MYLSTFWNDTVNINLMLSHHMKDNNIRQRKVETVQFIVCIIIISWIIDNMNVAHSIILMCDGQAYGGWTDGMREEVGYT